MIQHWRMPTTQHVTTSRLVNSFARNTNLYTSFLHRRHVSAVSGSFFRPRLPQISRRHTTAPPTQGLDDPQSKAQERAQELEYTLRISMQTVKIAKSHNLHDWEGAARILHNFLPEVEKFCKDSSTNSSIHSRHMRQLATIADKVQFLLTSKFATAGGPQATQGLIVSLLSAMADNDIIHEGKLAPPPPSLNSGHKTQMLIFHLLNRGPSKASFAGADRRFRPSRQRHLLSSHPRHARYAQRGWSAPHRSNA